MNAGKSLPTTLGGWLAIFGLLALVTIATVIYSATSHESPGRFAWWLGIAWLGTAGLFLDWYLTDRKQGP